MCFHMFALANKRVALVVVVGGGRSYNKTFRGVSEYLGVLGDPQKIKG